MLTSVVLLAALASPGAAADPPPADVVIYGGTSGGVAAAVQVRRMGKSVTLIEPSSHLGGLTTGGLGATDIGNKAAIGGISREFYTAVGRHYAQDKNWVHQKPEQYGSRRNSGDLDPNDPEPFWTFEPHVAMNIYKQMLAEVGVKPLMEAPLDRSEGGVTMRDGRIAAIRLKDGRTVRGEMFIDATYEGDLMAAAGVSYHVGREGESVYGESYNGVRPALNYKNHRFVKPVDPYVTPGDPSSGILPQVRSEPLPPAGSGDDGVQAYCFRLCATDVASNRLPWPKPDGYDESLYELLFRNFEAGDLRKPWNPVMMPNRKTDSNNNHAVSTDWIGQNHDYPEATDEERAAIIAAHEHYQKGLMWSLANHPRVPESIRGYFSSWGLPKDEFEATGGWPPQLYIREARRMIGQRVMTQADCLSKDVAEDPVGLAAYTMDSHNVWRFIDENGHVQNEGDVQQGGFPPYPIGYGSIVPKREEATNLLVPVAMSASHIAYGSIRMEPVFMVLGQSAATAAVMAAEQDIPVQEVDYAALRERLLADEQVLEWTGGGSVNQVESKSLKGVVADDEDAKFTGEWERSASIGPYVDRGYRAVEWDGKGEPPSATFTLKVPEEGEYVLRVGASPHTNRTRSAFITVDDGVQRETAGTAIDQTVQGGEGAWRTLDGITVKPGSTVTVRIEAGRKGYTIADAVWLAPVRD
ncbi:FAD-dependent oxidoreductase [Alienimonas californiensis]|uniref:FAD dependent oxidoreductase n=1 Tax=Alienimonas californiensis TaxID=2527989 RepID=A0A517PD35_9PLAN|nr:FAD-dependent oxidoreductase [Alienimonas californiensis]QDT17297.1 FAD dependent oxidoreductase [Alienimonas californiensis]